MLEWRRPSSKAHGGRRNNGGFGWQHVKRLGVRYTAEQKAEVIRRVEGGETQAAVAREAGISAWTVGQWVRGAKGGAGGVEVSRSRRQDAGPRPVVVCAPLGPLARAAEGRIADQQGSE